MSAKNSTSWFWSDWLGDQAVRRLTPAERGVWIDLLAIAAAASPVGYVCDDHGRPLTHEEIARVTNASPVEVAKLIKAIVDKGAASCDRSGRLYNRRMVRDKALAVKRAKAGKPGGEATQRKWQGFQKLPQQNARQVPPDLPEQTRTRALPSKNISSSLPSTAREEESGLPKKPSELSKDELAAIYEAKRKSA